MQNDFKNNTVYVSIYCFSGDIFLDNCIKSIMESFSVDVFIDLYIAGSKAEQFSAPFKKYNNIRFNILNKKLSYGRVANISLKKAIDEKFEYFMLLNSDTVIKKDCINILLNFIKNRPEFKVIGATQTSYDSDWDQYNSWTKSVIKNKNIFSVRAKQRFFDIYLTNYVQGACMLFRVDLCIEIGFFDERFILFYEEAEFCRRALKIGRVAIIVDARIKHYGGGTWTKSLAYRYKRDILYLSNQIIYESTELPYTNFRKFSSKIISIIKKQIKNIYTKNDRVKISIFIYPLVLIMVIFRINFLVNLLRKDL